jgi:signal transduction histidine kinase
MNALIHATPDSDPAYIWLKVSQTLTELILSVADNGPGIPKKEQKQVFSPFVRGKRSEQNQKPGTGLGLSLIQRTVIILQGKITLHSPYQSDLGQTEKGCLFTVTLPIRVAHDT